MLINLQNLTVGYGRKAVLSQVTLQFENGCAGLLGPNGAGKSTLLKTIMGFLPSLAGSGEVFGMAVPARAMEIRSHIGYMPESESFIPGMSAVQFVAYMARLSGLPQAAAVERSHEVLQYVGLGEARYRNLETYSLGMKQRAKLAQAIVHDPRLLLLDEPTNGMDPNGRLEMLELVNDLVQNKGMSIILCSHLLHDIETVADQVIVLGNGRVVSRQVKEKLPALASQPSVYQVRVSGPAETYLATLEAAGLDARINPDDGNILVAFAAEETNTRLLFQAAAGCDMVIRRLELRQEKLEDIFVQAVGELGHAHL